MSSQARADAVMQDGLQDATLLKSFLERRGFSMRRTHVALLTLLAFVVTHHEDAEVDAWLETTCATLRGFVRAIREAEADKRAGKAVET